MDVVTGRTAVDHALAAALDDALDRRGRMLFVAGEAGMGKTTAAQSVARLARSGDADVAWAACRPDERLAYGPWRTVLASLDGGAEALTTLTSYDVTDSASAPRARAAAEERAIAVLSRAAQRRPLLVVVDDLHWADDGTVRLLAALRGLVPAAPMLVVGTYRDDEIEPASPLATLTPLVDRIVLTPLTTAEVAALVADVIGRDPGDAVVDDVVHRAGGNPFLVVQVARLLASGDSGGLPGAARDVLRRRLDALPADVRAVLDAGAVLGSPFTVNAAAAVANVDADAALDALARARAARVVEAEEAPGRWAFVHELFRVAVLDAIPVGIEAQLHRAAAGVAIDAQSDAHVVAHHLVRAATGPDADAARWSLRAADESLTAMDWEDAAVAAQRALTLLPVGADSDETRAEAWLALGRAKLLSADVDTAVSAFTTAAALARSVQSVELLARAALAFAADLAGFEVRVLDQRQIDLLEEAAAALAFGGDPALRARVLARLSVALSFAASDERRLALAEQAVALARSVDDPRVLAGALAAHCDAIAGPADIDRRLAESSEIVELATATADGGLELLGRRLRFVALLEAGDLVGAKDEMAAFGRRAEELGNPLYRWYVPLWQGMWALAEGDIERALRLSDEAAAIGREAGSVNAQLLSVVARAERSVQVRDMDALTVLFDDLAEVMGELVDAPQALGNSARVYFEIGRAAEARERFDRFHAAGVDTMPRDAEWLPGIATCIEAAVRMRHPVLAPLIEAAEPFAGRFAVEGIGAAAHGPLSRFIALGKTALGEHDDAIRYARRAVDDSRAAGALVTAHAERVLADALLAKRADDPEGRALAASVDERFRSLGLEHFVRGDTSRTGGVPQESGGDAALERDGDVWHVTFGGRHTIVKHSKGLQDLAVLLVRPGVEVHVTELETLPAGVARATRATTNDVALDRRAIAAYRERLTELDDDIADAEAANDVARAERARIERDFLVDELSGAVGLGGRARGAGPDPVERLRKAVTARVRDAIRRIDSVHPSLGRHLGNSVRTGTYCSYQPEQAVVWRCEPRSGAPRA